MHKIKSFKWLLFSRQARDFEAVAGLPVFKKVW